MKFTLFGLILLEIYTFSLDFSMNLTRFFLPSTYVRTIFSAFSVVCVISFVTPAFLVVLLPLSYLYRFVRDFYLQSSREIQVSGAICVCRLPVG